jgi:predicted  nucleic acid-binding Zn-ribbon protein
MQTRDRAEPAEPALDGILGRLAQDLREFISRITDQRHAEQLEFEQRMSAVRKAGEMRQKEKESLEMQIQGLQQRLQELTREGVAGESEMKQLEIGYNAAAEKWKRAMEKLKDQISTAIPSVVRFSIHSALIRALIDLTNIVSYVGMDFDQYFSRNPRY